MALLHAHTLSYKSWSVDAGHGGGRHETLTNLTARPDGFTTLNV